MKAANRMAVAQYTLMNKNTPVLDFEYDPRVHQATRITRAYNLAAAPIGLCDRHNEVSLRDLNYWWRHRSIPASRAQINRLLENLKLESTLELAERSFGLSLSDRYWINDNNNPQTWGDINFFDNDFPDDLGFLTLGQDVASPPERIVDYASVSLISPNSTLGGDLMKKWKIIDGKRVLLKAGVGAFNQEPYNEVVATDLHARLMKPGEYVPYRLFEDARHVYSACDNMLGPDEELVPAWDVIRNVKQPNNLSDLQFYVSRCVDLGLREHEVYEGLAKMFACDFVLANRDRHYRNFGLIRNVETLEIVRMAPVFDSGSCLWSNAELLTVPADFMYRAKPFKINGMDPAKQVSLFKGHFAWFNADTLEGFPERVEEILGRNPNIPEPRIETIAREVRKRVDQLMHVAV